MFSDAVKQKAQQQKKTGKNKEKNFIAKAAKKNQFQCKKK